MKISGSSVTLIAVLLAPLSLSAKAPEATKAPEAWSSKMREIQSVLNRLFVDISSDERFNDKKNFKTIEKDTKEFAKLAHDVSGKNANSPDKDPSIGMIASDFAVEADYAAKSYAAGHRAYARVILGSMTNYCIACHTRTNSGPSFVGMKIDPRMKGLDPIARGNYFAAIREFDQALGVFEKVSTEEDSARSHLFDYEKALRSGLSIAVRVKRDPDLAIRLVDNAIKNAGVPFYLREQAKDWKKSLVEWKAEKPVAADNIDSLFAEATRLVAKAREIQKFPADRSADMVYLRASGVIHQLLGLEPKGIMGSNALYLAGLSYDVLDDYGVRDFGEFYYRSCIRQSPHTEVAKACYRRYEESVFFGYTGSGGTFIPSDVRARMNDLELLSTPQPTAKATTNPLQ